MATFYRRLFFWVFVAMFLATAPLAVLYSQGYRFDQYKKIFIHSGSITVKSTPSSVNVFLNGENKPSSALDIINNSITINGLRPGNYDVRVSADGYGDWEKNVEVHSGVSTEFWNVFLPPLNTSPVELSSDGAEKFFPSPFGKNIAYFKKNGDNLEVWSIAVKNNSPALVYSNAYVDFSHDPHDNIEWNSKEQLMIVPVTQDGKDRFLVLDSEKQQDPIFLSQEVSNLSGIEKVRWDPGNQSEIYFLAKSDGDSKTNLYRIALGTNEPETVIEGVKAYDLSSSAIYFFRQNDILYKTDLDGKNEKQIIFSPINFSDDEAKIRLIAYDDDRQAIISDSGELYVHNNGGDKGESLRKISDNDKGAQFSNDGKKLLYWGNNDINVLFLRKWDVQPRREENEVQQIIRFSSQVSNVLWYRDYEHIFFSTQNAVKIIELDSRDHRTISDVMKYNSENFLSSYDSSNGIFYFLDDVNGTRKIFYFNIPEQTGFLGG
jgi:hypothetical protein